MGKVYGIVIKVCVQGIGFRPFIYRLVKKYGYRGFVRNTSRGAYLEIEDRNNSINDFITDVKHFFPKIGFIKDIEVIERSGFSSEVEDTFFIMKSEDRGDFSVFIPPDMAICKECEKELFDSNNSRRYLYPFTNCGVCGERFSIIRALPFDRERTSMESFPFCKDCKKEYEDEDDRRFHIQTFSCRNCGPRLIVYENGKELSYIKDSISYVREKILRKEVVLIKGTGGYLLSGVVDFDVIAKIRDIKRRKHKPLALMFPNMELVKRCCYVSSEEENMLLSNVAPIVLLRKREGVFFPENLSYDNDYIGVFLPYSGLFKVLFHKIDEPLIMTSANISSEPILYREDEVIDANLTNVILMHNREITSPLDDSVVFVEGENTIIVRRSRGYVPIPIILPGRSRLNILGLGAHKKTTFSLLKGEYIIPSQEIGEMDAILSINRYRYIFSHFRKLFSFDPDLVVCDMHPFYETTKIASEFGKKVIRLQHHKAHILSVLSELGWVDKPVIGVAFDGTGYGEDGILWGGELFFGVAKKLNRAVSISSFRLPSGELAIKHPIRIAFSLLYEFLRDDVLNTEVAGRLQTFAHKLLNVLKRGINSPYSSSIGRLFDAVSSLLGISDDITYEGQAAIRLERMVIPEVKESYNRSYFSKNGVLLLDTINLFKDIYKDYISYVDIGVIATKFHNTIVDYILDGIQYIMEKKGVSTKDIIFSGGVFQNRSLVKEVIKRLREKGYIPHFPQTISPNDSSISIGQAYYGYILTI